MVNLVFHAESVGPVCRKLAEACPGKFRVLSDKNLPDKIEGTIVRWGSVAQRGSPDYVNSSEAVALARNKRLSRQRLGDLSPKTWYEIRDLVYPCVIRPRHHHGGVRFYVVRNRVQAERAVRLCRLGWYGSELIEKDREFRVFCLKGYVVAVSERFPNANGDVMWNLAKGGKMINVRHKEWPVGAAIVSLRAMERTGLDWGAVDIAIGKDGRALVFEMNTAPGLRNPFTLHQIATALVSGTPEKPKEERRTWKSLIHPSLRK